MSSLLLSSLNVCEVTDEDGIAGIAYEFDESTLPYGFYKDVEFSKTTVTISAASLIKPSGKYGGGKIVIQPGASIKKEKKTGKMNKGNSNLRGSSDTLFDRKLSQKIGDRYVERRRCMMHRLTMICAQFICLS